MTARPISVSIPVRVQMGDDRERLVAFLRKWLERAEAKRKRKVA